jgi:hypothetical protein
MTIPMTDVYVASGGGDRQFSIVVLIERRPSANLE